MLDKGYQSGTSPVLMHKASTATQSNQSPLLPQQETKEVQFSSSRFYKQKIVQTLQKDQERLKKAKVQFIQIPKKTFQKIYHLPINMGNKLGAYLSQIVKPQIVSYFNNQFHFSYQKQNKQVTQTFKYLVGVNLFVHTFSIMNEVYQKIKEHDKQLNQYTIKHILLAIAENQFHIHIKQLQYQYKLPGNKEKNIIFLPFDHNRPLRIQRTLNEQHDIFIRDNIFYPDPSDARNAHYLAKTINHILKISKSQDFYKIFTELNKLINHNKTSGDYSKTCKEIRKNIFQPNQLLNLNDLLLSRKIKEPMKLNEIKDNCVNQEEFVQQIKDIAQKSSALVRILAKFIQSNEDLINQPKYYILQRTYPFKDIKNNMVFLDEKEKKMLSDNIQKIPKRDLNNIRDKLFELQAERIFDQKHHEKYIGERQNEISTKIYNQLVSTTITYCIKLIELIIQAGKIKNKQNKDIHINLINFNVRDLFRATIKCHTQQQFKNILGIINQLDRTNLNGSFHEQTLFKAIKISNKIQRQNTVLLNYLLRRQEGNPENINGEVNQVTCELQVKLIRNRSQQQEKKHLKQYNYSHCLYEFKRGRFGVISQIATVIKNQQPKQHFIYAQSTLLEENKSIVLKLFDFIRSEIIQKKLSQEAFQDSSVSIKDKIKSIVSEISTKESFKLKLSQENFKNVAHWISPQPQLSQRNPFQRLQALQTIPRAEFTFVKTFQLTSPPDNCDIIKQINKFINIQYLVLRNCEITSISSLDSLLLTHKLKKIILPGNKLSKISQFQQHTCFNLQTLDLSDNNFKTEKSSIVFQLDLFPELKQLDLSQNELTSLKVIKLSPDNTREAFAVDEEKRIENLLVVASQNRKAKRQLLAQNV